MIRVAAMSTPYTQESRQTPKAGSMPVDKRQQVSSLDLQANKQATIIVLMKVSRRWHSCNHAMHATNRLRRILAWHRNVLVRTRRCRLTRTLVENHAQGIGKHTIDEAVKQEDRMLTSSDYREVQLFQSTFQLSASGFERLVDFLTT